MRIWNIHFDYDAIVHQLPINIGNTMKNLSTEFIELETGIYLL